MLNSRRVCTLNCLLLSLLFNFYTSALDMSDESVNRTVRACMSSESLESDYLKKELEAKYPESNYPIELYDIKIEKPRSGLVMLLTRLLARKDGDRKINFSEVFKDQEYLSCEDSFCLADKAFGEGVGVYYLYILDKFNLDLSPYSNYKSGDLDRFSKLTKYSKKELIALLKAVQLLPEESLKSLKFGYDAKKSNYYKGNTLANASINFFKLWSDTHEGDQIYTVIHEIGHVVADLVYEEKNGIISSGIDASSKWAELSEWKWDKSQFLSMYSATHPYYIGNFVSSYAKSNPAEDFAESFTTYILNPEVLKAKAMDKYNFIKKYIFADVEYSNLLCNKGVESFENDINFDMINYMSIKQNCVEEFVKASVSLNFDKLNRCIYRHGFNKFSAPLNLTSKKLAKLLDKKNIRKQAVRDLITNLFKNVNSYDFCKMGSGGSVYLNSEFYISEVSELGKNLCRWSMNSEKRKGVEYTDDQAKEFMINLLERRMTP